ncbi:MAG: hypothetical protein ABIQ30_01495 [Devosia sp.]
MKIQTKRTILRTATAAAIVCAAAVVFLPASFAAPAPIDPTRISSIRIG